MSIEKSNSTIKIDISGRRLSIIVFSLFSSWMLSFAFQGQILYSLINQFQLNLEVLIFSSIGAHFGGLFICGLYIRSINAAKKWIIGSSIFSMMISSIFFFPSSVFWIVAIIMMGFISGNFIGAWGFFFKRFTPKHERIKTAADVLIYSNILMILIDVISFYSSPRIGLGLAMIFLMAAFLFAFLLPVDLEEGTNTVSQISEPMKKSWCIFKPLLFLNLFIVIITINSGLMYQVFNPAYSHLEKLTIWYWAVPYIVALIIMRNLPKKTNRTYILYIAIAMIGFSFILFLTSSHTTGNYLLVNTLMLGACGIYDLFWWSILGEMLEFHHNPARIFGIGLSANVLGVLLGSVIGTIINSRGLQSTNLTMLALGIVLISYVILPPLHKSLSILMADHTYLKSFYNQPIGVKREEIEAFTRFENLSERESQVATLLIQRKTYKMIGEELFISENTVKYYVKNIYSKYHVQSRAELIDNIVKIKNTEK